jgi:hypothetical protein
MTDLERFVELYKSFGIECKVIDTDKGSEIWLCAGNLYHNGTISDKFTGYYDFFSIVRFDFDGVFMEQSFVE